MFTLALLVIGSKGVFVNPVYPVPLEFSLISKLPRPIMSEEFEGELVLYVEPQSKI